MKRIVAGVLLGCSSVASAFAGEVGSAAVASGIENAILEPARAVTVRNVEIDMGPAVLTLESGHLVPAAPIAGQTLELVFVGEGLFQATSPDRIEAQQLRLFTGAGDLETRVDGAVLVIGNHELAQRLLDRPASEDLSDEMRARATRLFDDWVASAERRGFGASAAIFDIAHGDAVIRRFFAVVCESKERGRFYYLLDPSELEQVTLGQFVPYELDDLEAHVIERRIRRAKKEGHSIQSRLEDVGDWDTWMRTSLRDAEGEAQPGSAGFEPSHYEIHATVDNDAGTISGRATVTLRVEDDGRRAVAFTLFSDLEPSACRDEEGRDLDWYRSKHQLHVILKEPSTKGSEIRVSIEYEGTLFERLEKGIFRNRSTWWWYPHAGTFDRATYDVTLRWPRSLQLLGSGQVAESATEGALKVERRTIEIPVSVFTFEIGEFEIVQEQVGHVALTIGLSKSSLADDKRARKQIVSTLIDALPFYEQRFGAYPLDYLTVATIPRGFSQGAMGFLTLSHYLVALPKSTWVVKGPFDDRETNRLQTVAHELAHQWWGNKVGWYNYRDQWLSEALADYSAVTYMTSRVENPAIYLSRAAKQWSRTLNSGARNGYTVESLGPVVLGERLVSSKSSTAYTAIVYDKGAVVFSMLARTLGEEPLSQMLASLSDAVANRAIDTEVFFKSLEHMSGVSLGDFVDRFVYGTGVPEFYYTYRVEPSPAGGWRIVGEVRPMVQAGHRYQLVRAGEAWDVARVGLTRSNLSGLEMVVPFQVVLEEADSRQARKERRARGFATGRGLVGKLLVRGETMPFAIDVPEKPAAFFLDQQGLVLARFYNESRAPKRALRYRAMELDGEEAIEVLLQALSQPIVSEQAQQELGWSDKTVKLQARREDGRIHLELSQAYLDLDRQQDAVEQLAQAERLFGALDRTVYRSTRDYLACRIAVRAGDYKRAWNQLDGKLYLRLPRTDALTSDMRRRKWMQARSGRGDAYALLAVAAFETGHEFVGHAAAKAAMEREADVSLLWTKWATR